MLGNHEPSEGNEQQNILANYSSRMIRLNRERYAHIMEHPEMRGQYSRIAETIALPDFVITTVIDPSVHVYHRFYLQTPVTRKYMLVAVKIGVDDAFVLTAFFSSRKKKGVTVWEP